jgi:hypothetical protein
MTNQPNKIFLQLGLEQYGETCENFNDLNSSLISWCSDKIYDDDLCYISVYSVLARIKELETERDNEESSFSAFDCNVRISELRNLIKNE